MPHPMFRPRRLREKSLLRSLIRETALAVDDLVYPLFVVHGRGVREPIGPMPGQSRLSIDELVKECKDAAGMGIPAVLLFGLPEEKDPRGSEAYAEDGIVQQGLRGAGVAVLTTRVIGSILTIVLYPFSMVPAIFLYYDLRTRREGLDIDFGTLPHPTPTAAA